MKNTLAENMLRFGAKNLTESSKQKLEQLAEQTQVTPGKTPVAPGKTPAVVKRIPNSNFNYVVGEGGSAQAVNAPLAIITTDITLMKYRGQPATVNDVSAGGTTDKVIFKQDYVSFGVTELDNTTISNSIKPITAPTSMQVIESISYKLGCTLEDALIVVVWLSANFQTKFASGNSVVKNLAILNNENAFLTTYNKSGVRFGYSKETWLPAMKKAGLITA